MVTFFSFKGYFHVPVTNDETLVHKNQNNDMKRERFMVGGIATPYQAGG